VIRQQCRQTLWALARHADPHADPKISGEAQVALGPLEEIVAGGSGAGPLLQQQEQGGQQQQGGDE
jgi:hypothetical protein